MHGQKVRASVLTRHVCARSIGVSLAERAALCYNRFYNALELSVILGPGEAVCPKITPNRVLRAHKHAHTHTPTHKLTPGKFI